MALFLLYGWVTFSSTPCPWPDPCWRLMLISFFHWTSPPSSSCFPPLALLYFFLSFLALFTYTFLLHLLLICALPPNRNSLMRDWPTWCETSSTLTRTTKTWERCWLKHCTSTGFPSEPSRPPSNWPRSKASGTRDARMAHTHTAVDPMSVQVLIHPHCTVVSRRAFSPDQLGL